MPSLARWTSEWLSDRFDPGPFWTAPNAISLLRLVLAIPIAVLIVRDGPFAWLFGLTIVAIVSDWVDGGLARWTGTVSEWGRILDPLADKVAAAAVLGALFVAGRIPPWFFGLVIGRDLLILLGGTFLVKTTGRVVASNRTGKAAAAALALTVLMAILGADPEPMRLTLQGTAVLLLLSIVQYGYRFFQLRREPPEERTTQHDERDEERTR